MEDAIEVLEGWAQDGELEPNPGQLDPAGELQEQKHMSNVWRSWSENASPELRAEFESRTRDCIQDVRRKYSSRVDPQSGEYRNLRRDCIDALCRLSEAVQAEHDAQH